MFRNKLYLGAMVLCMLGLLLSSCAGKPSLEIENAYGAKDVILVYLQENYSENASSSDISWHQKAISSPNSASEVLREFTSDEWDIEVSYAVLPPESMVYEVTVYSIELGWYWRGNIRADGTVKELIAFTQLPIVEVSCEDFIKLQHINKEVELKVEGILVVILCTNTSTGFKWSDSAQISDPNVIQQKIHRFVAPESEPPPPPGTEGHEVWIFEALKKGVSTVYMEYSRPWEGGEKGERTYTMTVTVK